MSLVTLPEELLLSILQCLKDAHDDTFPRTTPSSHALKSTLQGSAIDALSLTCRTLRRITLPMLFESVGIVLPFISHLYQMDHEIKCLKANQPLNHLIKFMHIKTDKYTQGVYKYFVLEVLRQCPQLKQITLPWYVLCTDTSSDILHAIEDHPNLQTALCSSTSTSLKDAFPRPGPMTKVKLQSISLKGPQDLSGYPTFLQRELSIRELRLTWVFDFTQLAKRTFRGLEKLMLTDSIDQSDLPALNLFLDSHASTLSSVVVKRRGPAQHILQHLNPSLHGFMQTLGVNVRTLWLAKTAGRWLVKDLEADMQISGEDPSCQGLSDAINALGVRMPAIEKFRLGISVKAPVSEPLRLMKDFVSDAFSTYDNLQYLTLGVPEQMLSVPKPKAAIQQCPALQSQSGFKFRRSSDIDIAESTFLETAHGIAVAAQRVDMVTFEVEADIQLVSMYPEVNKVFRALVDKEVEPRRVYKGEMARIKGREDTTYYEYVGEGWPAVTEAMKL